MAGSLTLIDLKTNIDQYVTTLKQSNDIGAGAAAGFFQSVAQMAQSANDYLEILGTVATESVVSNESADTDSLDTESKSQSAKDYLVTITDLLKNSLAETVESPQCDNELYQALVARDFSRSNALLASQPDLLTEITLEWKAELLRDFIDADQDLGQDLDQDVDNIIRLLEIFGSDTVKQLVQDSEYDFIQTLFEPEYVKVLKKLRQMAVLGPPEKAEMQARVTDLTALLANIFDDE